jgi:hypothetical protein
MSEHTVKRIPYGIADYEKIVKGDYYFVDKTGFLREIEDAGSYLFFIRPRRFGKSLFLSLMETYYDVLKQDQFEFFYRGTDIYHRPTGERHAYLVLKFNFSSVEPSAVRVEDSFINHVKTRANVFISRYAEKLKADPEKQKDDLKDLHSASDVLQAVIGLCMETEQKLYVIIDEYDNFANTILSTTGSREYRRLTHGAGFFRTFFNVLKAGATGSGAPISRLFVGGVSPITMDDVTSGFNIGENISIDPGFNRMLGFTHDEVRDMLQYYRSAGWLGHDDDFLMDVMGRWYNHYNFSKDGPISLFNSDMVLYFLKEYFKGKTLPNELIDRNVRMDYGKVRHLILIEQGEQKRVNGNFPQLRKIVEDEEVHSKLVRGFPLEDMALPENFISLLFYLGLLTIKAEKEGRLVFTIPNLTVKSILLQIYHTALQENRLN